jgi:bifunctional ADP-heptose synthase (sugar kinase/adenylyltransferase)
MNFQVPKKSKRILVVGDDCTDVYRYGTVDRISPEAPVPVFKYLYEEHRPGMAGNVVENLKVLGCNVSYLHGKTSTKTRLVDLKSKQQIVRIDQDQISTAIKVYSRLNDVYDAIVISDYNKGTIDYELIEKLRKDFVGPIFVDTKKTDLARLQGCIIKINQTEYDQVETMTSDVIVTLGARGARYQDHVYPGIEIEVADVCGAGDTFLSALVYQYLETASIKRGIEFAIRASAVTVQHLGAYAPNLEEIN